jgi:hypothetical protein
MKWNPYHVNDKEFCDKNSTPAIILTSPLIVLFTKDLTLQQLSIDFNSNHSKFDVKLLRKDLIKGRRRERLCRCKRKAIAMTLRTAEDGSSNSSSHKCF